MKKKLLSSIYPITKLLIAFLLIILSVAYDWRFAYLFILPVCLILSAFEGNFKTYARNVLITLTVLILIMFLFKFLLDKSNSKIYLDLGILKIREWGVRKGLIQTKAVLTMAAVLLLFFETTDMEDFMISLQKMNVSHVVTYIILSTMQLIPEMIKKSAVIMQAQQARGIETVGNPIVRAKAFFPSLGPLIISSVTDIEDQTVTLEVRGFSSSNKKTNLKVITMKKSDKMIMIVGVIVFVLMLIWRFI